MGDGRRAAPRRHGRQHGRRCARRVADRRVVRGAEHRDGPPAGRGARGARDRDHGLPVARADRAGRGRPASPRARPDPARRRRRRRPSRVAQRARSRGRGAHGRARCPGDRRARRCPRGHHGRRPGGRPGGRHPGAAPRGTGSGRARRGRRSDRPLPPPAARAGADPAPGHGGPGRGMLGTARCGDQVPRVRATGRCAAATDRGGRPRAGGDGRCDPARIHAGRRLRGGTVGLCRRGLPRRVAGSPPGRHHRLRGTRDGGPAGRPDRDRGRAGVRLEPIDRRGEGRGHVHPRGERTSEVRDPLVPR